MSHKSSNQPESQGASRGTAASSNSEAKALGRSAAADHLINGSMFSCKYERNSKEWTAWWSGWHQVISEQPGWTGKDEYTLAPPETYKGQAYKIPIGDLAELTVKHKGVQAILFLHQADGTDHVVTWGKSNEQCLNSAEIGNRMKEALGWPEHLKATPKRIMHLEGQAQELVQTKAELQRLKRKCMDLIERGMGVTAANVTSETRAKVLDAFAKWYVLDP